MKSHVFLTPMSPSGKPGEVVELEYAEGPVMYAELVSPYASNDEAAALAKLKKEVAQAEADLRHAQSRGTSPTDLLRFESALSSLKQELDQALTPRRQQRQRETGDGVTPSRQSEQFAAVVPYWTRQSAAPTTQVKAEQKRDLKQWLLEVYDPQQAKKRRDQLLREGGTTLVETVIPSTAKNSAPGICCTGRFLCPACEAKKAAAA